MRTLFPEVPGKILSHGLLARMGWCPYSKPFTARKGRLPYWLRLTKIYPQVGAGVILPWVLGVLSKEGSARREVVADLSPKYAHHPSCRRCWETPTSEPPQWPRQEVMAPETSHRHLENWMNQVYTWEVESIGFYDGLDSLVQEINSL